MFFDFPMQKANALTCWLNATTEEVLVLDDLSLKVYADCCNSDICAQIFLKNILLIFIGDWGF